MSKKIKESMAYPMCMYAFSRMNECIENSINAFNYDNFTWDEVKDKFECEMGGQFWETPIKVYGRSVLAKNVKDGDFIIMDNGVKVIGIGKIARYQRIESIRGNLVVDMMCEYGINESHKTYVKHIRKDYNDPIYVLDIEKTVANMTKDNV